MSPWIAKAVVIAANVATIAIRAPRGRRSRQVKTVQSRKGALETGLLMLAGMGFIIPFIWIVSSAYAFAEYPLRLAPLVAGTVIWAVGLWLFHRSHADLGDLWSVTLELREGHKLITRGVYRRIRHPMYASLFLGGIGQALVVPNWFVGPSYLVAFGLLYALRVRFEERMMLDTFGGEYAAYMASTKRLIPGVW